MNTADLNHLRRVKQLFEEKTGVVLAPGKPARRPVGRALALAAAVACCLAVTAFAANYLTGGALTGFFQRGAIGVQDNQNQLSDAQERILEDNTAVLNRRSASARTALTLTSVTGARSSGSLTAYLVLEVEAPAGAWVGVDADSLFFENAHLDFASSSVLSASGGGCIEAVLDDPQGRETVKRLVFSYQASGLDPDSPAASAVLTLENLYCRSPAGRRGSGPAGAPPDGCNLVAEGRWTFDLPLDQIKPAMDLIGGPVPLAEGDYTLTHLELSPFGLYLALEYPDAGPLPEEVPIEPALAFCNGIQLVLADDTRLRPLGDGPAPEAGPNTMLSSGATVARTSTACSFKFDVPIDIQAVAYLLFPDGTRIFPA